MSTILTTALNATILELLATPSIPLRTTFSTLEAVMAQSEVILHPTEGQRRQAKSSHVLAFDNNSRELILCESWGEFSIEEWESVVDVGEKERGVEALLREKVGKLLGKSS